MSGDDGGKGEPWHRLLVDEDHAERMGDIKRDTVGPLATIRTLLRLVGTNGEGRSRLPALREFYESNMSLPTSVNAKRAKLAAEALSHDPFQPSPSSGEWDPDRRVRERGGFGDEGEGDVGLPRRGES